jgi:hypothetical protein
MASSWKPPKGVRVIYKGRGFRKKHDSENQSENKGKEKEQEPEKEE